MQNRLTASFAVYKNPTILAILFLGFASGLPLSLTLSTLSAWLTGEGISKSAIGLFSGVTIAYSLKFLWSPLVDNIPIPWLTRYFGRRRSWLFFTQTLLAISIFKLGSLTPSESPWLVGLWALCVAFTSATQDIILDAYRVELLKDEQQGDGSGAYIIGYRIGMLVSSAGALYLAQYYSWFVAYSAMAALVLVGSISAFFLGESKASKNHQYTKNFGKWIKHSVVAPFIDFMQKPSWLLILLFVLFYKFGDAFAGLMTTPFLLEMGFSYVEIADVVKFYGFFATIIGAFIGGAIASRVPILAALLLCGVLQMVSNLLFLWQLNAGHDTLVLAAVISMENLAGGMGTAAFVAYISQLCNKEFTATQYALLSSLSAVGRTLLATSSGVTVDFLGWANFFLISTVIALPGLVLLVILDRWLKR